MGVRRSREPDPERARAIAEDGCILRAVVGSTVHGLANPGTDDRDEMGVCIEPPEYVLGLRPFEHWVFRTQPEGVPSGPGDLDLTIYGLRKYCRLAAKGSPTVLLLLFVGGEHVLVRTAAGAELQRLAPAFVSRRAGRAFLGYLDAQRRGLLGERWPRGPGSLAGIRPEGETRGVRHATRTRELSAAHGYDTKYAMHALRIAYQGIELITRGRITLPVPEPARSHLMAVRRGEPALPEVVAALAERTSDLEQAVLASDLPDEADRAAIDAFLIRAYRAAWEGNTGPEGQDPAERWPKGPGSVAGIRPEGETRG
jgi:uncharacterized protein